MGTIKIACFVAGSILGISLCSAQSHDVIIQKYNDYYREVNNSRLMLIFHQQKYYPGDTAFFKVYLINEDLQLATGNHLINVDLVDSSGKSVLHQIVKSMDGKGRNQMIIPNQLGPGYYNVVAFSGTVNAVSSIYNQELEIVVDKRLVPDTTPFISVAVEGGNLVANVFNKVVVHTSQANSPLELIDDAGIVLQKLISNSEGFSFSVFMPEQGKTYFIKGKTGLDRHPLPAPELDGCSILASATQSGMIKMLISAPKASMYRHQELSVIVSAKGKIYRVGNFSLGYKEFVPLEIKRGEMPQGIIHVAVLTSRGDLITSRDFYVYQPLEIQTDIETNKTFYTAREKVKLDIALKDSSGKPLKSEFSVSVTNMTLFDTPGRHSFLCAVHQMPEVSCRLLNESDSASFEHLDLLMILNNKSEPWSQMVSSKVNLVRNPHPINSKRAIVYNTDTSEPVPAQTRILFYLQKAGWWYQTVTSENGVVSFTHPDFYGLDEFFCMAETKTGKEIDVNVVWDAESHIIFPPARASTQLQEIDAYADFSKKVRIMNQSFNFFKDSSQFSIVANSNSNESIIESLYASDVAIQVQQYVLFPTMDELIREIVPSLFIRRTKRNAIVRVSLHPPMIAAHDPLYIIDGIVTKNSGFFLSLDPSELLSIGVINDPRKLMPLGLLGKNGVVIVKSKSGNLRTTIDSALLVQGQNTPLQLGMREYTGSENSDHPDFRSSLYWNPSIDTDENGLARIEFYTSDDITDWLISINGFTHEGKPFSATRQLKVQQHLGSNR